MREYNAQLLLEAYKNYVSIKPSPKEIDVTFIKKESNGNGKKKEGR